MGGKIVKISVSPSPHVFLALRSLIRCFVPMIAILGPSTLTVTSLLFSRTFVMCLLRPLKSCTVCCEAQKNSIERLPAKYIPHMLQKPYFYRQLAARDFSRLPHFPSCVSYVARKRIEAFARRFRNRQYVQLPQKTKRSTRQGYWYAKRREPPSLRE